MASSRAKIILQKLKQQYPHAAIVLRFSTPFELLIATILSAQCTDKRVNIVTQSLFKKYRNPGDYARVSAGALAGDIRSTGFYRNKAKNIIASCRMIENDFKGKVPSTMEELVKLPGVARKTANIVLSEGFNIISGIAVDTHVKRISIRLGLSANTIADKIEADLMALFDKRDWSSINRVFIAHGRTICQGRSPQCRRCPVNKLCAYFKTGAHAKH